MPINRNHTEKVNSWIDQAVTTAKEKGWHDTYHSDEHFLALIVSELCEAMQADRNNRYALPFAGTFVKQNIEFQSNFVKAFELTIKDTFEDELSDTIIRCCDFLGLKRDSYKGDTNYEQNNFKLIYLRPSFTEFPEFAYACIRFLTDESHPAVFRVACMISIIIDYCNENSIDIDKYIELKMSFNPTRPYRHGGKKY